MKKFLKNDLYLILTLLFLVFLFKYNLLFKSCILSACHCFFKEVFPTLFPMFIINDLLLSFNFIYYLNQGFQKIFQKLFHFSNAATYVFLMSLFSGTPTNAYIITNLVKEKNLKKEDASIILSYSFFLNPLFLFSMLNAILNSKKEAIVFMIINICCNIILALSHRNYPYQNISLDYQPCQKSFGNTISKSIQHAFQTLFLILGTMIVYFLICEAINLFLDNQILNCIVNGSLEVTGGLTKLKQLSISLNAKKLITGLFISFGGLSIHSQIKSIISDANISYKPFLKARFLHMLILTSTYIIIS